MESYGIQSRKSTLTLLMGQRINMLASSKAGNGAGATFGTALRKGEAKAIMKVSSVLMQEVENGSLPAIIFYLKCRAGWTEEEPDIKEIPPMIVSAHTDATN
jgi:hypothetical protein